MQVMRPSPTNGSFGSFVYAVNEIGMNLAQGDDRPQLLSAGGSDLRQEGGSIAFDCAARVLFGESEIESISPVNAGNPTGSGAETVNQPRKPSQGFSLQDRE